MRYKIISFMIVALMTISVIGVSATENSIQIKVADVCDEITSTTTQVPVLIENNTGFASFTIIISYDNSKLKPIAVTKGSILNGTFISNLTYSSNSVRLVYASSDNTVENGAAFFIEFELLSNETLKTNIDIDVEFLGDSNFAYPNYIAENGTLEIVENLIPFDSRFLEVSFDGMIYNVNAEWENRTASLYEDVNLHIVAYDVNGRMVGMKSETHSFHADEIYQISCQLHSSVPIERIKLLTWDSNMKPYISATEKEISNALVPFESYFSKIEHIGSVYDISATWENNTEVVYKDVNLYMVAYDVNGRMVEIKSETHSFSADEIYEISWQLHSSVPIERIKLLTWDSNMKPYIPVVEKGMYEVCIEQFSLHTVEDITGYKILLSSGETIDDEIVVFVAEYADDGRMLGIQSKEFITDEYITGNLLYDNTATVKCLVWKQSNMQPKALCKEVSVR